MIWIGIKSEGSLVGNSRGPLVQFNVIMFSIQKKNHIFAPFQSAIKSGAEQRTMRVGLNVGF